MTKLIIVKYPQSKLDIASRDQVMPNDSELGSTEKGKEIAMQIGQSVATHFTGKFSVWSGPRLRCLDPANLIADSLGTNNNVDLLLDERRLVGEDETITVGEFRLRQERGFLDPSRHGPGDLESPLSHRLRVETWLTKKLATSESEDVFVIVSHGAVVEHIHSSLNWKPAGAMQASFTYCAPGHAHLWSSIDLPDRNRIWCCLGANIDLLNPGAINKPLQGIDALAELAVELASDARFQQLLDEEVPEMGKGDETTYIR